MCMTQSRSAFRCGSCRQVIKDERDEHRVQCDPLVVTTTDGTKICICGECKDLYYGGQEERLLSSPQHAAFRQKLLAKMQAKRPGAQFCRLLTHRIGVAVTSKHPFVRQGSEWVAKVQKAVRENRQCLAR